MAPDRAPAPFVVGVARSGTTLLRLQLDAHPDLAIPAETGFGPLAATFGPGGANPAELLDALVALPTWPDLGIEREELGPVFAAIEDWSVGAGLRAVYTTYADRHGKPRWGDKTPGNAAYVDAIARVLPEARFVHLIRDGRDVAASLRGLPFAPGDGSVETIAAHWRDTVARTRRLGGAVPHYMEVRYERLVSEPEATLRSVCEFLELSFDEAMLRAHERAEERLAEMRSVRVEPGGSVLLADGTRLAGHVRRPPDASRAGRWREVLSDHDVTRFERFAGGALAAEGYPLSSTQTSNGEARGRLRIVIGTHRLSAPGGTESYVATVARELERLGHEVTVTAEQLGPAADAAERAGMQLARSTDELPPECDALLVQDATMTAVLAQRYPTARLVYVAHSGTSDHQLPVQLPGVVDVIVANSDRFAARIRSLALDVPIVRLREPIDTDSFTPGHPLPERPRRALILSNYLTGERARALLTAWEEAGIECTHIGVPATVDHDPRSAIADADIVVAKARAALEGMTAGRAVYVYDQFGGDGWVTPDNYPAFEADNFAGLSGDRPRTPGDLRADLDAYHPDMGWMNRELARIHHGARHHATELVALMRGPHAAPSGSDVSALAEVERLTRAYARMERRAVYLEHDRAVLRGRTLAAEDAASDWQARAAAAEHRAARAEGLLATKRARAGLALGRALDRLRGRR